MRKQVNKAEWHEYQRICRNCVFWKPGEDADSPMGVCTITDIATHEAQQSCSDLRFLVYDAERE